MDETTTKVDDSSERRSLVENGGPGDLSPPQEQKKQTNDPLHKVLAMTKGDGENSYSQNSKFQDVINKEQQSVLIEGLEFVSLPDRERPDAPVVVADLGSSSTANSISNVALIVDKLRIRSPPDAEFQVYFNDLPSNDFNQLFRLLSVQDGDKNFFGAGVPGSFYGRLFPRSNVHVFHSSFCLHWLSKVPDAVLDKNSPAYNSGDIWFMQSHTVAEAYKEQSSMDLKNFLRAREVELHPGGLLYFNLLGRGSSDPLDRSDESYLPQLLVDMNDILGDLVSEGLLDKEVRDSFNYPVYPRNVEEIKEAVESCGGAFRVLTAKTDCVQRNVKDLLHAEVIGKDLAVRLVQSYKAFSDGIMEASFPKNVLNVFWQRMEELELSRLGGHDLPLRNVYMLKVCLIKV